MSIHTESTLEKGFGRSSVFNSLQVQFSNRETPVHGRVHKSHLNEEKKATSSSMMELHLKKERI